MPPQPWKTLQTRQVYKNKWMRLREDIAELPNGRTTIYGVCEFGECVGVLPFVDDQNVVMVRQFRYVQQENYRWEMPTGGIRPGEKPEQAAQRELMERAVTKLPSSSGLAPIIRQRAYAMRPLTCTWGADWFLQKRHLTKQSSLNELCCHLKKSCEW